jgi:hypothetical protein
MKQIFDFNQGDYNLRFSPNGICAVLSAKWIQLIRDSKSSGYSSRKDKLEQTVNSLGPVVQQMAQNNFDTTDGLRQNLSGLIRHAGQSVIKGPVQQCSNLVVASQLKDYICHEREMGVHLTFGWTEGVDFPAHTIAFWRSGEDKWHNQSGHIYAFDPNYGEYRGNKSEFSNWFSNFLMPQYANNFNWTYYFRVGSIERVAAPKFGRRVM